MGEGPGDGRSLWEGGIWAKTGMKWWSQAKREEDRLEGNHGQGLWGRHKPDLPEGQKQHECPWGMVCKRVGKGQIM